MAEVADDEEGEPTVESAPGQGSRARLLEKIGDGEGLDVAVVREENARLRAEMTGQGREIALLKAQLHRLQQPDEGLPPM